MDWVWHHYFLCDPHFNDDHRRIYQLKQKAAASMLKRLLFYFPTFVTMASPFFPTRTVAKRALLSTLLPVPSGIK
jgi:hypothetical protein